MQANHPGFCGVADELPRTTNARVLAVLVPLMVWLLCPGCSSASRSFWNGAGAAYLGVPYTPPENQTPNQPEAPQEGYSPVLPSSGLLLFGGRDHHMFLGCLNCSKFDTGSIWNKFGEYGSRFNEASIWNTYGTYGSKYSDESPWNPYGQTPPVIVDNEGKFYGYFTANKFFPKRNTIPAFLNIIANYESIEANFDAVVDSLK